MKITLQVNGRKMTFSESKLVSILENHFSEKAKVPTQEKAQIPINWGDHTNPTLYPGYTKIEGTTWEKGPQALDEHGYPMVWIPAAIVMPKGLSRVHYDNSQFSDNGYHEEIPEWRLRQIYDDGGFWSPANPVNENWQLMEGALPLNNVSYENAIIGFKKMNTEGVGYKLAYGAEIDCICEWLKMNGYSMTDSTEWGNYSNTPNRKYGLAPIGSRKEARTSIGINDFAGTLW